MSPRFGLASSARRYHIVLKLEAEAAAFARIVICAAIITATLSACGEPVPSTSPTEGKPPPSAEMVGPTAAPIAETASVPFSVPLETTVGSTGPGPTQLDVKPFSVAAELGRVSGQIPADAGPNPIEDSYGTPPDFVVGVQRWVVGDCCRLAVVLQDVRPLLPDKELISTIESGGLIWNVYDGGPEDGTEISALATVGKLSIIVSGQTLFKDNPSERSTIDVVVEVVKTIGTAEVEGAGQ